MAREDYVSFEQAKALKELGFDWECYSLYNENGKLSPNLEEWCDIAFLNYNYHDELCSAPTLAQAQKWLREVKRIVIAIIPKYEIQCDGTYQWEFWYEIYNSVGKSLDSEPCGTYEYALETAIDKALEILKDK